MFAGCRATERMMAEVGHQQQPLGSLRQPLLDMGHELEHRVEGQQLNACRAEQCFARDHRTGALHHAVCPLVAIADRILQELALAVQEAIVHAPRVHAGRLEAGVPSARRVVSTAKSLAQAGDERRHVPAKMPLAQARCVRKPMRLLQPDAVVIDGDDEQAPAAGAEIDSGMARSRHYGFGM